MTDLALADVFQPGLIATAKVRGYQVPILGYAFDGDNLIAIAFAESKTRCQAVWASFLKGDEIAFRVDGRPVRGRRQPGKELYETLQGELPGSGGYVVLLLHRAALTAYFAEPPDPRAGRFSFFYAFGPAGGKSPHPIWLSQLRQLLLLPELPGWVEALWPQALDWGLARPLARVTGFNPIWRIEADESRWRDLYRHLVREGRLQVPA